MSDDFASRMKRRRAGLRGSGPIRTITYACVCGKAVLPLLGFCSRYCAETAEVQARQEAEQRNLLHLHGRVKVAAAAPLLSAAATANTLSIMKSLEDQLYTGSFATPGFDGLAKLTDDDP